jgi:hypothetical protein
MPPREHLPRGCATTPVAIAELAQQLQRERKKWVEEHGKARPWIFRAKLYPDGVVMTSLLTKQFGEDAELGEFVVVGQNKIEAYFRGTDEEIARKIMTDDSLFLPDINAPGGRAINQPFGRIPQGG